jgi:hypothetical protein
MQLKERTVNWNRDRGLLETFDPCKELEMLSEELREFYYADSFAHRLVEYADFIFVLDGTIAKFACRPIKSTVMFEVEVDAFERMLNWARQQRSEMFYLLNDMYKNTGVLVNLIRKAREIVIENNELKSNKKKDGKIVKNKDHVDPAIAMGQYLFAHGIRP